MLAATFFLLALLLLKGDALPSSATENCSTNSSAVNVVSTTERTNCGTSGLVTVNIQDGEVGPQGERGPPGPAGPTGPTGPTGQAGLVGRTGSAGQVGLVGRTGSAGPVGSVGRTGPVGSVGSRGPPGPAGPTGLTGRAGSVGRTGSAGRTGPTGQVGSVGPQGLPGPAGPPGANTGGVSFTRWGRTTCLGETQRLYEGTVAGSHYSHAGSAEYLCLHKQPQFLRTTPGVQGDRAYIYGTEYRAIDSPPAFSNIAHHDAPCAVCYAPTRTAKITIPARTSCPPSWTREYYGYLMADKPNHKSRVPLCVDVHSESVPGSAAEHTNSLLYFIETICNGIACPPYSNGAEITCVVCTK